MTLSLNFPALFFLSYTFSLLLHHVSPTIMLNKGSDREALLEFKSTINKHSLRVLATWNDSQHFCQWDGVICSSKHHHRVVSLDLQGLKLGGFISPAIGNLSFLTFLNLANNAFKGYIPSEVEHLIRLRNFNISHNSLQGNIPSSLSNCSELVNLALEHNKLEGHIPFELGSLSNLLTLSLHDNNLTGTIPPSIGNLSSLQPLLLFSNQLEGEIPTTISLLSNLKQLGLAANKFYGNFPTSIYNLSSLKVVSLAFNSFSGNLRHDIGLVLPNLQVLYLSTNNLTGLIPASLANASGLSNLDLSTNSFTGIVPVSFGYLQDLEYVNFEENLLGGDEDEDLEFIIALNNCSYLQVLSFETNKFRSYLPSSITNLSTQLKWLSFGSNYIQGSIPTGISQLSNLYTLAAENNFLTGIIPHSIGQLNLQSLSLAANNLTGQLPSSLGNISGLLSLLLNVNHLQGSVPTSIGNCRSLETIDLSNNKFDGSIKRELFASSTVYWVDMSDNQFDGPLPSEIKTWAGLTTLDISNNKLSGSIPTTLSQCWSLEELYMQNNLFHGSMPNIRELKGIRLIDLSNNNLLGQIPSYMVHLSALQYVNLSFNKLEGEVPIGGVFHNASGFDIQGNIMLCGGIQELLLKPCPVKNKGKTGKHMNIRYMLLAVLLPLLLGFILLALVLYCKRKSTKQHPLSASSSKKFFEKISYKDLFNATDGFSQANFIGSGAFGTVYRGTLASEDAMIAVKVLNLEQHGALKSFTNECNALRNVRHRNLVKVLTACSSIDFHGHEFKAIVYEYMLNGSLETWLHPEDGKHLNLCQRINIATDVAYALYYLHEECETPVIHCDLKPSNVLLDNNFTAHVSDFGMARLLTIDDNTIVSQLSSAGIRGTIGYIAPEYSMGGGLSAQGDVFSFGILLLEMFTGKKPTDEQFQGNFSLQDLVKQALPVRVLEIVDQSLLFENQEQEVPPDYSSLRRQEQIECLTSILQIGLLCLEENPRDRMKMEEVKSNLMSIRDWFIQTKRHYRTPRWNFSDVRFS